jgi:hypothetical protein
MKAFLASAIDSVLDLSAATIVNSILIALILSLPVAAAYAISRRWHRNLVAPLLAISMAVNLLAMIIAAGHTRLGLEDALSRPRIPSQHSTPRVGTRAQRQEVAESLRPEYRQGAPLARSIVEGADENRDGRLSAEEASAAAGSIIKSIGAGRDSVDAASLRDYLHMKLRAAWVAGNGD